MSPPSGQKCGELRDSGIIQALDELLKKEHFALMSFHRAVLTVGSLTIVSRLLGFLRDMLMAIYLGAGPIADAFVVAQRIPNIFRSLFAEGAIDPAFVPIYSRKLQQESEASVRSFVNQIFTIFVLVLVPLSVLSIVFMDLIVAGMAPGFVHDHELFQRTILYSRVAFGYIILISVTALIGGVLNARGYFAPYAAAPAILNIIMIGGFVFAGYYGTDAGLVGSWALTLGGLVQLVALYLYCRRFGPPFRFVRPRLGKDVKKFFKLVGPGVFGASADQINFVIMTIMASTLTPGTVAALYYASHLNQLPLGVIGGAIGTALLPELTRHVAANEPQQVIRRISRALELGIGLSLPMCLVLVLAPDPIVRILFQHGQFDPGRTHMMAMTIAFYALMIPAGVITHIFTMCFFAHENTKIPVTVAFIAVIINGLLASFMMPLWQHVGIALAFALSVWANALALWWLLAQHRFFCLDATGKRRLSLFSLAGALMGLVVYGGADICDQAAQTIFTTSLLQDILSLTLRVCAGGLVYCAAVHMTGALRLNELKRILKPNAS
jgi:putative peptidoglycan lipid II flippase